MAATSPEATVENFEKIINQMRDVISSRVIINERGAIDEIHVLAGSGRSPKQIVRDIESAFVAHFDVKIDHKKISIAQLGESEERLIGGVRVMLNSVGYDVTRVMGEARVKLEFQGQEALGIAKGANSRLNRLRLVAQATLNAVEEYFQHNCVFTLEDVREVALGQVTGIVVAVCLVTPVNEQVLIGAVLAGENTQESVAKATLDAMNRQFLSLSNGVSD